MYKQKAFTLVELITVIVITGIVGAIGLGFFVSLTKSYNVSQDRARITNNGLIVLEQLSRRLRLALPFSLRTSSSGNCVEFFPVVAGTHYYDDVPDSNNNAPAITSLAVAPFQIQESLGRFAFIAPLSTSSIYSPSVYTPDILLNSVLSPGTTFTLLNFDSAHVFENNSVSKRVFLTDNPIRYCYVTSTGNIERYSNYSFISATLNDAIPSGATITLMAQGVSSNNAFSVSSGSVEQNATVTISLNFNHKNQTVPLSKTVMIQNVP